MVFETVETGQGLIDKWARGGDTWISLCSGPCLLGLGTFSLTSIPERLRSGIPCGSIITSSHPRLCLLPQRPTAFRPEGGQRITRFRGRYIITPAEAQQQPAFPGRQEDPQVQPSRLQSSSPPRGPPRGFPFQASIKVIIPAQPTAIFETTNALKHPAMLTMRLTTTRRCSLLTCYAASEIDVPERHPSG